MKVAASEKMIFILEAAINSDLPTVQFALDALITATTLGHSTEIALFDEILFDLDYKPQENSLHP